MLILTRWIQLKFFIDFLFSSLEKYFKDVCSIYLINYVVPRHRGFLLFSIWKWWQPSAHIHIQFTSKWDFKFDYNRSFKFWFNKSESRSMIRGILAVLLCNTCYFYHTDQSRSCILWSWHCLIQLVNTTFDSPNKLRHSLQAISF